MEKVDLKKKLKPLYQPSSKEVVRIDVPTMHIGPFSEEGPAIERVHEFIARCGCRLTGKHHEIYLSDIRRADPKKWKTIVRQPMVE